MSTHIGSQACSGTSEWQSWGQHITVPSGAVKKAAMTQGQSREDTARPRCQAELTRLQEDSHLQILPQKGLNSWDLLPDPKRSKIIFTMLP